jgi:hypothetical protein
MIQMFASGLERNILQLKPSEKQCHSLHVRNIVIQILSNHIESETRSKKEKSETYYANRIEQTFLNQRLLDAIDITFPPTLIAITDSRPCPINSRTATAEQQVIVQLIFLGCRSSPAKHTSRGPFDGNDNGRIVGSRKHMATETVIVWLPTKRIRLAS